VQVGALFGLNQLGDDRRGGLHPGVAQPRHQRLGKARTVDDVIAVHVAREFQTNLVEAGQRLAAEAQLAVGVILDDQHTVLRGQLDQTAAAFQTQRAPGGVLEVGDGVEQFGLFSLRRQPGEQRGKRVHVNAALVGGHLGVARQVRLKRLQGAQVGRRLDEHEVALVNQNFAEQVEPLLAAGHDLHVRGGDAVTPSNPLAQRQVALGGRVLQRGGAVLAERGFSGLPHGVQRKQLRCGQAPGERNHVGLLGDFQDFADGARRHGLGAARDAGQEVGANRDRTSGDGAGGSGGHAPHVKRGARLSPLVPLRLTGQRPRRAGKVGPLQKEAPYARYR